MKIILASASPRRRELLKIIVDDFEAVSTDVDESLPTDLPAEKVAEYLSKIKAMAVENNRGGVIIGCDTIVACKNKILGKPKDIDECRSFISMLSGETHKVITGCTLICGDKIISFSETTEVAFRKLTNDEIEQYIATSEPYDKAGGYGIQGKGALLVEKINGDYFNVVGLPVSRLNVELKEIFNEK